MNKNNRRIDRALLKLAKFIFKFQNGGQVHSRWGTCGDKREFFALGYNEETGHYRFAGVTATNTEVSPIYYYDISKEELSNLDKQVIIDLFHAAVDCKFVEVNIENCTSINPGKYVFGIVNILLREVKQYFTEDRCLNGHVMEMGAPKEASKPYELERLALLSVVKDKDGNFKNVDDDIFYNIDTIEEIEEYLKEHYDELINKVK